MAEKKTRAAKEELPNRPMSGRSQAIKITEYGVKRVNPEPVPAGGADLLLEEYLSPRKLVHFLFIHSFVLVLFPF